jgi:hypothetical protein
MSQTPAKIWNLIGWIVVALIVVSIFFAMTDPVMGVFAMYAAIAVGGLSGVGMNATVKFGVVTIVVSLLFGLIGTHYTTSTGIRPPQLKLIWSAVSIFALPILVSATLLSYGVIRRRHADGLDVNI